MLPAENVFEPNIKALAGTSAQGYIRNYMLSKFQNFESNHEGYDDIARIVAASRSEQEYPESVDILTARNRRGRGNADLKTLFKTLQKNEIHYDKITLAFCRSNLLKSLLSTKADPCYKAFMVE
ncbi:MAG: putative adhesin [Candidatus Rhabdochlamydia sp.]